MTPAGAQDADLAKKLSNPVASLISVPFQWNYDHGFGPSDGDKVTLNIQAVIPISLNEHCNLISRTIVPVVWQDDIAGNSGTQFGLSDTTQSFFFSPKEPTAGEIIWGLGPVLLLPTGTDDLLSTRKWGAGPTGVVLRQSGPWTYGALANHVWSYAGDGNRSDVNSTFLQPFLSYTTKDAWTFTLNSETTYDWTSKRMVGSDQCDGCQTRDDRQATHQLAGGGSLLCGKFGQRSGRLRYTGRGHVSLPEI
ncbi:hypothetical protein SIAM614_06828 [Roseibium aggregatum IAM 12614]|uniref:Transporter n=1 Tax=Roseibium aggregatum (strain ATCC 25650 / DSM 13394 / JCM 20685 / NBRC 16684 / NCIMB 2208 / IAM 12614 / B1) TaxID=384765 RepID=A0NQZ1_ROSAI|nr:hypothetical protein SIAM614_06828 [Roseibium aggregatum IAM 12614]